jgi:hypothetical protein
LEAIGSTVHANVSNSLGGDTKRAHIIYHSKSI